MPRPLVVDTVTTVHRREADGQETPVLQYSDGPDGPEVRVERDGEFVPFAATREEIEALVLAVAHVATDANAEPALPAEAFEPPRYEVEPLPAAAPSNRPPADPRGTVAADAIRDRLDHRHGLGRE